MEKKSIYKLRLAIGVLGLTLPVILWAIHGGAPLRSMSHYYYTSSAVAFIGIIGSFSLVLFSYYGYPKTPAEKLSDNAITSIAAIAAALLVIIPTASDGVEGLDYIDQPYLLGYVKGSFKNIIHLLSAGVFIALLGAMSYFKFTLSPNITKGLKGFYKLCGLIVWISVGCLAVLIVLERVLGIPVSNWFPAYVFWFEAVAVWAFSFAWIRKGLD